MHLFNGAGKQITKISLTPLGKSELNMKSSPVARKHTVQSASFQLAAV